MPGQPYRSKLNPHFDFIREARLREETWEEIARRIGERGTPTDRSQVCRFFRRKLSGRRPLGFAPETAPPEAGPVSAQSAVSAGLPSGNDLLETPGRNKLVIKVSQ